jgi:hypothetical protein
MYDIDHYQTMDDAGSNSKLSIKIISDGSCKIAMKMIVICTVCSAKDNGDLLRPVRF